MPQIKLIALDLDGTLAAPGEATALEDVQKLKELERRGIKLAVVSGKPVYYLTGFLRQMGLQTPIMAGESGAVIQVGVDLPPRTFMVRPYSEEARESLRFLEAKLHELLPDLWYQPNLVGVAAFPYREEDFAVIARMLEEQKDRIRDVDIYRHGDCYDFLPHGLDKSTALEQLGAMLHIRPEEMAAVGDGVNDCPMFARAGLAIGINYPDKTDVAVNFASIGAALDYLLELTKL